MLVPHQCPSRLNGFEVPDPCFTIVWMWNPNANFVAAATTLPIQIKIPSELPPSIQRKSQSHLGMWSNSRNFMHALHLSFIVLAGWPRDLNRRQCVQISSLETTWCIILHKINSQYANSVAHLCDPTSTAAAQLASIQNYSKVHLCGAKCVWHDALLFNTAKQSTFHCFTTFQHLLNRLCT